MEGFLMKLVKIIYNRIDIKMNGDEVEELNCPVCMCLFTTPVTIQCGHTFCRYCLMNSVKSKNSCPICRNPLTQ